MDLMTIGEVSSRYQISARMLRYYEKAGLLESSRREGYAYRVYDGDAVRKVRQIIALRKLQIPLKQIQRMMNGPREEAVRVLEERIRGADESAAAMRTIKRGLERLLELLREGPAGGNGLDLVRESALAELTGSLPLEKHRLKEEQNMRIAKEMVEKESCVRIVLLPPCTVAACRCVGDAPEEAAGDIMNDFVRSSRLYERKPDARLFGFNNPAPEPGHSCHGYEDWVTIPDGMEVPAPLVKKYFPGGLYAAYAIAFPDFHEWDFLRKWVENSEIYRTDYHDRAQKDMRGCLEEHLNWVYSAHMGWPENGVDGKVDLLLPIKLR